MAEPKKIMQWYVPRPYEQMRGIDFPALAWAVALFGTFMLYGPILGKSYKFLPRPAVVFVLALIPLAFWLILKAFRWICRTGVVLSGEAIIEDHGKAGNRRASFVEIDLCQLEIKEFHGKSFIVLTLHLKPPSESTRNQRRLTQTAMPLSADHRQLSDLLRNAGVKVSSSLA